MASTRNDKGKYANTFASARPVSEESAVAVAEVLPMRASKRVGKYRDPDWKQVSIYVKKRTSREVNTVLDEDEEGPDFSELVESLLAKWLKATKI